MDTEDDRAANPEPFGLVRSDMSERPAFATYRLAVGYLSGALRAEREHWDEIGQIRVDQKDQTTTVLFSRLPEWQRGEVVATDETAQLIDMWGTKQIITPTEGIYSINLPPASCSQSIGEYCMIGGPNYYLVQTAEVLPSTATPLPTVTPAPSAMPIPAGTPKPTDTLPPQASPTITVLPPTPTAVTILPTVSTLAATITSASTTTTAETRPASSPADSPSLSTAPETEPEEQSALNNLPLLALIGGGLVLVAGLGLSLLWRNRRR